MSRVKWMGIRAGMLVDRSFIEAHFASLAVYRGFVLAYVRERQDRDWVKCQARGRWVLGG